MLGIEDKYVSAAYVLCLCSSLLCIVYGFLNWNRGEVETKQEDLRWAAEEHKVEDGL